MPSPAKNLYFTCGRSFEQTGELQKLQLSKTVLGKDNVSFCWFSPQSVAPRHVKLGDAGCLSCRVLGCSKAQVGAEHV